MYSCGRFQGGHDSNVLQSNQQMENLQEFSSWLQEAVQ